jgi:cytochrome P450
MRFLKRLTEPDIVDAVLNLWRQYGDTAAVPLPFGRTLYFINDPADVMEVLQRRGKRFIKGNGLQTFKLLIGHGVTTSEHDDWIRHRRMVQPNFHHRVLGHYVPAMVQAIKEHRLRWLGAGDQFQDFNVLFPLLSQDVVARTLLGADLTGQLERNHQVWDAAMDFILARTFAQLRLPISWPLPSHRRFRRSLRFVRDMVDRMIAEQAEGRGSSDPNTFLARALSGGAIYDMTREQLRDQVLNILFAGIETTANGLSSTLYFVLSHPEVEQRLLAEIEAVLGREPPHYQALERQSYLRQVVHESMRLYPPVCVLPREALEEVELSTVVLPKGAAVWLSPYVMHRHPKLWRDPDRFDPERFDSPALMEPPHFMAFGAGARTCVGDQFAINEMMLVVTDMLQNLRLELDRSRPIGFMFNGTFRPDPVKIRMTPRH